jgi:hypothetical protein
MSDDLPEKVRIARDRAAFLSRKLAKKLRCFSKNADTPIRPHADPFLPARRSVSPGTPIPRPANPPIRFPRFPRFPDTCFPVGQMVLG